MNKNEVFNKIVEHFPQVEPREAAILLEISNKMPEFKLANLILKNHQVDLFHADLWSKADIYQQNNTEISNRFQPIYNKNNTGTFEQGLSPLEKIAIQHKIIKQFLEKNLKNDFLNS